ncbi:MAG: ATP-binding protein [Rhodothermales bacterium]
MRKLLSLYGKTVTLIVFVFFISFTVLSLAFLSISAMEEWDQVRNLEKIILSANSGVRDFMISRDPQDAKDTELLLQKADLIVREGIREQNFQQLRNEVLLYLHSINNLIEVYQARGFFEEDGVEGQIRDRLNRLERDLKMAGAIEAHAALLLARRAEKNYLLREGSRYVDQVHNRVDELMAAIRTSGLASGEIEQIDAELRDYQHDFDELVSLIERGHWIRYDMEFIQRAIANTLELVVGREQMRARRYLWLCLGLMLTAFLMGIVYSMFVARTVLQPLDSLRKVVVKSADGHEVDWKEWEDEAVEQLQSAKTEAEAESRNKAEFLASMSHEIRTPLNGIIGMTSLLNVDDMPVDQREVVDVIRTSGESLLSIVNHVLDFSKIEAGAMTLEEQTMSVHSCVEDALGMISRQAAEKGLDLSCSFDDLVPQEVVGDATRLRQILINLLGNAVKFTHDGEIQVRVKCSNRSADSVHLEFQIQDTGIGIAPENRDGLFEPFKQAEVSTSRRFGGTGLGLTIIKRLAELMNGTMWVESELGRGSTFCFSTVHAVSNGSIKRESIVIPGEQRVLFLSKHPLIAKALATNLATFGLEMDQAYSEEEASDLLSRQEYFAVFINECVSGFDGVAGTAVARMLKSRAPETPFTLIRHIHQQMGDNSTECLIKPLRHGAVLEFLRRQTGSAEGADNIIPLKGSGSNGRLKKIAMADRAPTASHALQVLLVEDNPVNQKVGVRMLERLGCQVDVVDRGEKAVKAVLTEKYSHVFMDLSMPGMDGLEATEEIRKLPERVRQPIIIALTANATTADRAKCLEAGMDDYASKPVDPTTLRLLLERHSVPVAIKGGDGAMNPSLPPSISTDS